ncbi:hypothetical protein CK203_097126 [Vitis vinifera]|uniref:Uncharacterized protein n=1 Tax=Vitis vinifera TaxID=29760 RepID=A0A438BPL9_VITVI|nr:hypothetical protein CK203_097126 [Vitis vinifera]
MDRDSLLERERYQIQQIRELEFEELQIEEVDDLNESDDDAATDHGYRGAASSSEFTFDTCLASLHTYLGEVEDTHHRLAFLDGGAVWALPLFYLEAAVEKALHQADAPYTIGVVHVERDPDSGRIRFSTIGQLQRYRY